jgi:hypothetical protein
LGSESRNAIPLLVSIELTKSKKADFSPLSYHSSSLQPRAESR